MENLCPAVFCATSYADDILVLVVCAHIDTNENFFWWVIKRFGCSRWESLDLIVVLCLLDWTIAVLVSIALLAGGKNLFLHLCIMISAPYCSIAQPYCKICLVPGSHCEVQGKTDWSYLLEHSRWCHRRDHLVSYKTSRWNGILKICKYMGEESSWFKRFCTRSLDHVPHCFINYWCKFL